VSGAKKKGFSRIKAHRAALRVRDDFACADADLADKLAAAPREATQLVIRSAGEFGHMLVFIEGADVAADDCVGRLPGPGQHIAAYNPRAESGCNAFSTITGVIRTFVDCVEDLKVVENPDVGVRTVQMVDLLKRLSLAANDPIKAFPGDFGAAEGSGFAARRLDSVKQAITGGVTSDDANVKQTTATLIYNTCMRDVAGMQRALGCFTTLYNRPGSPGNGLMEEGATVMAPTGGNVPAVVFGSCNVPKICSRLAMQKLTHFARKEYSYTAYSERNLDAINWADHCGAAGTTNCRAFVGCFVQAMDRVCQETAGGHCCPGGTEEERLAFKARCDQDVNSEACTVCPVDNDILDANLPSKLKQAWLFVKKKIKKATGST
jgi:hypothetical protein